MKIIVNGKARKVMAHRLPELLEELDLTGDHVATALNGAFIPKASRGGTDLAEGDRVEILTPMQGG
jgi:sulfur carrier protein